VHHQTGLTPSTSWQIVEVGHAAVAASVAHVMYIKQLIQAVLLKPNSMRCRPPFTLGLAQGGQMWCDSGIISSQECIHA
jgi:hypothetical protein